MKILRLSDRIKISYQEIEVIISPLSYAQKIEISNCFSMVAGEQKVDLQRTAMLTLAYAVKDIKGINTYGDEDYSLEFIDESKSKLTDACTSELISLFAPTKILGAINSSLAGYLGVEIEGVAIEVMPKK